MRTTDAQLRKLIEEMSKHGEVGLAALRSGMDRKTDLPPFVVPLPMLDQPAKPSAGAERKQAAWVSSLVLEACIPANCAV